MTDDSNVRALPREINLDLDSVERPETEIKPPFRVVVNGREIQMTDPAELDWRDLVLMDGPTDFIRLALAPEDKKFLLEQDLPGWKFSRLMEAYSTHYELEDKIRSARRQAALTGGNGF